MRRLAIYIMTAFLTFSVGLSVWFVTSMKWRSPYTNSPLQVKTSPTKESPNLQVQFEHYTVTVKNISTKAIRGYSLGFTSNLYEPDSSVHPGVSFTNPDPERQLLLPGEAQTFPLYVDIVSHEHIEVWADLVHFTDGSNWGPNQSHTEGYVRE